MTDLSLLTEDDIFECENDSPEDMKLYVADLRAEIARLNEERRWIPVGERLPETETWVLVKYDNGDIRSAKFDRATASELWFVVHSVYGKSIHYRNNPTHWMPLPEPPEVTRD